MSRALGDAFATIAILALHLTKLGRQLAAAVLVLVSTLGAHNAWAQISRVGQDWSSVSGTSVAVSAPAGTLLGDVFIAVVTVRGSSQTINTPAGWTGAPALSSSVAGNMNQRVFYRVATAADLPPASHTFSWTVGDRAIAAIVAYRNVDVVTPINVTGAQTAPSGTNITAPSITTTVANTMLVGFFGHAHGGASFVAPAAMTQVSFVGGPDPHSVGGPNGVATLVAEQAFVGPGATGVKTATSNRNAANIGHILALRPVPVVAPPGSFNAFESSTPAGSITGVIRTKVAGTAFSLDVVAIAGGSQLAAFSDSVIVELLGNNTSGVPLDAQNCPVSFTLLQTVSPNPTISGGRSAVGFASVSDSWRDVRVRVRWPAASPTVTGCSTDNFAIRPNAFTSFAVSDTNWTTAGTTRVLNDATFGAVTHKAGRPFSVRAVAMNVAGAPAITTNYAGTPAAALTACAGAACTATQGALTLNTAFTAGQLVTDVATYNEVGSFRMQLIDDVFAAVDSADSSLAERRIQSAVIDVGRFVPDNFGISLNTPSFATACGAGGFTYIGQSFGYATQPVITVVARDAANNTTTLYAGAWWRITNASVTGKSYTAASGALDTSGAPGVDPAIAQTGMGAGTLTFSAGTGFLFTRTTPVPPFDAELSLAINVIDADGVTYAANPARFGQASPGNGIAFSSGKPMRFGRLRIANANGSTLVPLTLVMGTEYWLEPAPGKGYFVTNADDACTVLAAANVAMGPYRNNLNACETSISISPMSGGRTTARLSAPGAGNNGSVDLTVNLSASGSGSTCIAGAAVPVVGAGRSYLRGNWTGGAYDQDPSGRGTFGAYRGGEETIYQRENF